MKDPHKINFERIDIVTDQNQIKLNPLIVGLLFRWDVLLL